VSIRAACRASRSVALVAGLAAPCAIAGQPSASAQRPSLSFNATTAPRGFLELEAGAFASDGGAALPLLIKYGVTDRIELEFGVDAVRRVEAHGDHVSSVGDVTAGARAGLGRTAGGETSFAVVGFAKLPTAKDETGSGEPDLVALGIASIDLGRSVLDLNLGASALGRGDGDAVGQVQAIATYYPAPSGPWTPFVEGAWQKTAGGEGDGAFLDAGLSFSASRVAVLDAAVGLGSSDGFPDWTATVGWAILLGRPGR